MAGTQVDQVSGGAGNDSLSGSQYLFGNDGDDTIVGVAYADPYYLQLHGGPGNDSIVGSDRLDLLWGGQGANTLSGGGGDDTFFILDHPVLGGGASENRIDGGAGRDFLSFDVWPDGQSSPFSGNVIADLTTGVAFTAEGWGPGGPLQNYFPRSLTTFVSIEGIEGGYGDDSLMGSANADTLIGSLGSDTLMGGDGDDVLVAGAGAYRGVTDRSVNFVRGEAGNDSLTGGDAFDDMHGNMGNDTLRGGSGDDWVVGGKDDDLLAGEAGGDVVYGNLGADTCLGGDGADWVRGGQANDSIDGGAGDDLLWGDRGDDTVAGGAGADMFHFFADGGLDRVLDFSYAEGDRVILDGAPAYTVRQEGADTVIDLGGADRMVLVGVIASSLPAGWIILG